LNKVTHLCRDLSSFNLITVEINIQIQIFVLITLTVDQESALGIPAGNSIVNISTAAASEIGSRTR
jgi:hypothetical protein